MLESVTMTHNALSLVPWSTLCRADWMGKRGRLRVDQPTIAG
jgi:hypothetical protein